MGRRDPIPVDSSVSLSTPSALIPKRPPTTATQLSGLIHRTSHLAVAPALASAPALSIRTAPPAPTPLTSVPDLLQFKTENNLPCVSLLYCSADCAKLDETRSRSALFSHLPEVLPHSPTSPSFWEPDSVSPVYGSDSEPGDYFLYGERIHPLDRRLSRGTTTTASSSDSLQSLCDPHQMSRSNSSTSHNAFRKLTPLNPYSGFPISPRKSLPISADLLLPPPQITSPSLSSSPSFPAYQSRSSSRSSYHRSSFSSVSPGPRSQAFYIPSSSPSSYSPYASSGFEPGSAPATASLYAEYATSFQKSSTSLANRTIYGSPRRSSSSFDGFRGDGGSSDEDGSRDYVRGRKSDGRRRSNLDSSSVTSTSPSAKTSHQITPTQSFHLPLGRPAQVKRPTNSRRGSSHSSNDSTHSSGADSSHSGWDRPPPPSYEHPFPKRLSAVGPMLPPSPHRVSSGLRRSIGEQQSKNCAWTASERMYEIPRAAGSGADSVKGSLGSGRLFYWGE